MHPTGDSIVYIIQEEDGTFNFDIATVKNPVTGEKVREILWIESFSFIHLPFFLTRISDR